MVRTRTHCSDESQCNPKDPEHSVVHSLSIGGVIHITKSLLQAELVLQNGAASSYYFTNLLDSTNVQELIQATTAKALFWRDPLDQCSSYLIS